MHVNTPYLYLKRIIPTREVTRLQVRLYLKNKGVIPAGFFILMQLFVSFVDNILSTAKFHKLLKAGVPLLSVMKTNLQLYHLSKACSPADLLSYILIAVR